LDAQDDSEAVSLTCYSKCHRCHVERSETSFTPFRPLSLSFLPFASLSFRLSAPHCHVERSETSFTLFLPLSFRPSEASGEIFPIGLPTCHFCVSYTHFDRALPTCASLCITVLHAIRDAIPVMLSGAKHLSHYSAPLSFRPSTFHCHFDRAERVEKSDYQARHRRRNMRSPTTTAQALRGARPQRALLAPGCCLP